jgi:hypothetical protein
MVRKGMFHYDALLHVPMIWYAPGLINKGLSLENILQGQVPIDDEFIVYASAAYSDLPDGYWENPEPYFNPDSNIPFHTRVENLTWKPQYKTAMARTRNWKLIKSETHPPELYHMNGGYIERENLYGQDRYKEISEKLEQKIKNQWEW